MNRENLDFLYKMFPNYDISQLSILIVNQTTAKTIESSPPNIVVMNSFEKGLSKSRNLALDNATADWCLIADDDLVYTVNFEQEIERAIAMYGDSGIIAFKVQNEIGEPLKNYPNEHRLNIGLFARIQLASVELLIHRKAIQGRCQFNISFGLGSEIFSFGEEYLLAHGVWERLRLPISFYNANIVQHLGVDTGVAIDIDNKYKTQGALYAKTHPKTYYFLLLLQLIFDLKHDKTKLSNIFRNIRQARKGVTLLKSLEKDAGNYS